MSPRYTNRTTARPCQCADVQPPSEIYNCTLQRTFDRCKEPWMTEVWPPLCAAVDGGGGYCAFSCGRCSCPGDPPLPPLMTEKEMKAMMRDNMRLHKLGLPTGMGGNAKMVSDDAVKAGLKAVQDEEEGGVPEYSEGEQGPAADELADSSEENAA